MIVRDSVLNTRAMSKMTVDFRATNVYCSISQFFSSSLFDFSFRLAYVRFKKCSPPFKTMTLSRQQRMKRPKETNQNLKTPPNKPNLFQPHPQLHHPVSKKSRRSRPGQSPAPSRAAMSPPCAPRAYCDSGNPTGLNRITLTSTFSKWFPSSA